jgi:hypothetical protein
LRAFGIAEANFEKSFWEKKMQRKMLPKADEALVDGNEKA